MRIFHCERCAAPVPFDVQTCASCGADLGYLPDRREIRRLLPTATPAVFAVPPSSPTWWRCLNARVGLQLARAHGCRHRVVPILRPTRGRPDEARPAAMAAWMAAEAAEATPSCTS